MVIAFYCAAAVAIAATLRAITCSHGVHALLYFIVSLFSVATVLFLIGAPFVAVLEVIIYAGAVMVLFLFAVMLLGLGKESVEHERRHDRWRDWIGPGVLSAGLGAELLWLVATGAPVAGGTAPAEVTVAEVVDTLLGPYRIGVELASMLLLSALVGALHVGRELSRRRQAREQPERGIASGRPREVA